MNRASKIILFVSSVIASAAMTVYGQTITGDLGTTAISYGSAYALQTVNTGFGNASANSDSTGGSELDANYGTITGDGTLYLFLAGNFENNGNHALAFIQTSVGGQSTLNISGGWTASAMNGSVFSPGFAPTLLIDANDYQGTLYTDQYALNGGGSVNNYLGAIPATSTGIFPMTTFSGAGYNVTLALNNNHGSQMGASGGATIPADMLPPNAQTGLELAIPLAMYGWTGGGVEVMEAINGGGDGYMSNQLLPGLPVGSGNIGNGSPQFNFGSTPGEFYTVVPEPSSITLVAVGLLGAVGLIRRRK